MISKINKIKKLGLVFSNYSWGSDLSAFKHYNIIYGWNGSGKTTLSRLFDAINGSTIENLEYEVEDDQGTKFKHGESFSKKIRVFNQDYVQNNVKIFESRANSISILLGEENKELVEQIENDKILLGGATSDPSNPGKIFLRDGYVKKRDRKSTERGEKFTEIAKTIGAAIGGNALRDYRKPQAEKDFASITEKQLLSEEDLKKYSSSATQESLPQIEILELAKFNGGDEELALSEFLKLLNAEAAALLKNTVKSEVITRLSSNEDILGWVEQGLALHKKHSSEVCEYCSQKISHARLEELANHFNEADKKLKNDLDNLLEKLKKVYAVIQAISLPNKAQFYDDLHNDFSEKSLAFENAKKSALEDISKFAEIIKNKKIKTTEAIAFESALKVDDFIKSLENFNETIKIHNKTTTDFEDVKKLAGQKLKNHYLSTIFGDVKSLEQETGKLDEEIDQMSSEIKAVEKRISENMSQVSSKHKACEEINKKLATFLGHNELKFVPHTEGGTAQADITGYDIMRGKELAVFLSEGEKTAIAFVYFVVHLRDQEFNANDGIIVVDDPISSLDSNSLYQAFSFLKNALTDIGQVFVFTHNFDFLKLLINWRRHAGGAGYYMLKNHFPNDVRCAYIDKMDKELCEYESEYHYLFKLLKQLRDEQDNTIAKAYPVPNIARKVWDTFLMFSVPNGKSSYKKMDELKQANYDSQKLDAIYKFTNDQSHITGSGFDPALVPETKKVIGELFEMMAEISPNHFKIIDAATTDISQVTEEVLQF